MDLEHGLHKYYDCRNIFSFEDSCILNLSEFFNKFICPNIFQHRDRDRSLTTEKAGETRIGYPSLQCAGFDEQTTWLIADYRNTQRLQHFDWNGPHAW